MSAEHDGLDRGAGGLGNEQSSEPAASNRPAVAPDKSSAAISAGEARRQEITRSLITNRDLKPAEREALTRELKQNITRETTPDEAKAWGEASLGEQRKFFDLAPPTLPKTIAAEYDDNFGWAESELLTISRNEGLASEQVRGLRDEAVRLGLQIDGAPLPDEVVDKALKKYGLTDKQQATFKKLWRSVES